MRIMTCPADIFISTYANAARSAGFGIVDEGAAAFLVCVLEELGGEVGDCGCLFRGEVEGSEANGGMSGEGCRVLKGGEHGGE